MIAPEWGRHLRRAFGPVECALSLALIGLAAHGVTTTALRRAETPVWLRPITMEVWV